MRDHVLALVAGAARMYRTFRHELRLARRRRRAITPQQQLRLDARIALECVSRVHAWPALPLQLIDEVARRAGSAAGDELVDLEQVLLIASSR